MAMVAMSGLVMRGLLFIKSRGLSFLYSDSALGTVTDTRAEAIAE